MSVPAINDTDRCSHCEDGGVVSILETRSSPRGVRRRRYCERCQERWTTIEVRVPEGVRMPAVFVVPTHMVASTTDMVMLLAEQLRKNEGPNFSAAENDEGDTAVTVPPNSPTRLD